MDILSQLRPPAAASPFHRYVVPHPRVRGWASLWRKKEPRRCIPCPPLKQGWAASAYILSCAPLLVMGERATQWRGGIAKGSCLRQLVKYGLWKNDLHFFTAPFDWGDCMAGLTGVLPRRKQNTFIPRRLRRPPPSTTTWSPHPRVRGGQVYGGKRNRVTTSLAHPCFRGGWRAPIYSLAPPCMSWGRGPRSGEGGLPKACCLRQLIKYGL